MIAYHLLNTVVVLQPRWHDKVVLPAVKKFKPGLNLITTQHKSWPNRYVMPYEQLLEYPTETKHSPSYGDYDVYVIPLSDLKTIQEYEQEQAQSREQIRQTIESFGWWTKKDDTLAL